MNEIDIDNDIASITSLFDRTIHVEDHLHFPQYFLNAFGFSKTHNLVNLGYGYSMIPNDENETEWYFELCQDSDQLYVWYVVGTRSSLTMDDEKSLKFTYTNGRWDFVNWYP